MASIAASNLTPASDVHSPKSPAPAPAMRSSACWSTSAGGAVHAHTESTPSVSKWLLRTVAVSYCAGPIGG